VRTEDAQQEDAERLGTLMIAVLLLALVWLIALGFGRLRFAAVTLCFELVIGGMVLVRGLDESDHSDGWLAVLALVVALTGIGAVMAAYVHRSEQNDGRLAGRHG
jgi:hypothetical protein